MLCFSLLSDCLDGHSLCHRVCSCSSSRSRASRALRHHPAQLSALASERGDCSMPDRKAQQRTARLESVVRKWISSFANRLVASSVRRARALSLSLFSLRKASTASRACVHLVESIRERSKSRGKRAERGERRAAWAHPLGRPSSSLRASGCMRDGTQIGSLCTHEVAETGPRRAATVEHDRACTELARDGSAGLFCERRRFQGGACRCEQEERGRAKESTARRHRAEDQIGVRRPQLAREAPRRSAGATGRSSSEQRRAHAQLASHLAALPAHAHRQSTPAQHDARAHAAPRPRASPRRPLVPAKLHRLAHNHPRRHRLALGLAQLDPPALRSASELPHGSGQAPGRSHERRHARRERRGRLGGHRARDGRRGGDDDHASCRRDDDDYAGACSDDYDHAGAGRDDHHGCSCPDDDHDRAAAGHYRTDDHDPASRCVRVPF